MSAASSTTTTTNTSAGDSEMDGEGDHSALARLPSIYEITRRWINPGGEYGAFSDTFMRTQSTPAINNTLYSSPPEVAAAIAAAARMQYIPTSDRIYNVQEQQQTNDIHTPQLTSRSVATTPAATYVRDDMPS